MLAAVTLLLRQLLKDLPDTSVNLADNQHAAIGGEDLTQLFYDTYTATNPFNSNFFRGRIKELALKVD